MKQKIQTSRVYADILNAEKAGYNVIILQGGSRCFSGEQEVITKEGTKKISDIKVGEYVLSGLDKEYKRVKNVFRMNNTKPCYEITLKNGKKIRATQDHQFWYEGGWVSLKHVVKYWNERNMEKDT